MTFAERATAYAEQVVADEIPACLFVRQSCQRHLDDLVNLTEFVFDHDAANYVCGFVETMPHVKGEWGMRGETIVLEDWQCFAICLAFGWLEAETGLRRFRRAYWEVSRKNAKSTLSAALADFMLTADGEFGAEVYIGATTEKQAGEVFDPARQMVLTQEFDDGSEPLRDFFGVTIGKKNLSVAETNSKLEPVIGNPGDGASPHFAITDEYHEHRDARQLETMLTGMGSRRQPMSWVITTAGANTAGPCYALRTELVNVLSGTVENNRLCGAIWTLDEGDAWDAPETLIKANPNLGVSVFESFLLQQQVEAVNDPLKQSAFKSKHLNVWVTAANPFFNSEKWHALGDAPPIEEFAFASCFVGLDLASKVDLCAKVLVFEKEIEGKKHFFAYCSAYLPDARIHAPGMAHYLGWHRGGQVVATPGDITDYDQIEADVAADAEAYRIVELGFDPHNATQLITHIGNHGVACVEVPQTVLHLSEPMKEVQALVEDGRLHHDGNPVFAWGIGNVTAVVDRNENVFPRKERRENKIDPAVALIIAMSRVLRSEGPVESTYQGRGLTII
jgi:phage terminase large subunit-like protein